MPKKQPIRPIFLHSHSCNLKVPKETCRTPTPMLNSTATCIYTERSLWSWIVSDNSLDLAFVCSSILLEQIVRIGLCWRVGVGFIEKLLDPKENLLNSDCRLPTFFLIQNRQADGARGVNVWVEERWNEFA